MSLQNYPNQFRRNLQQGQTLIGCWSALANHISAEVLGLMGFDWLVLDGEHAPNDVTTFIPQLMALKGSNSAPVVRAPCNEPIIIKRLLDIGFYNFLIPFVESEEEAIRAVASTRYPPAGIRGFLSLIVVTITAPCPTISPLSTTTSLYWYKSKASKGWTILMPSPPLMVWTVFLLGRAICLRHWVIWGSPIIPKYKK